MAAGPAPRPHPLAARRRLGQARRHRRRKRSTRSSSEPIRWGRRPPMPRPRRRRRQVRQHRHPSGLRRLAPPCSRRGPRRAAQLRPMARCRSFPIRTALRRPLHAPALRWRVRPSPVRRNEREPAPPAGGGGYAVQVTSQRSEADAQAEFRTLRSKFPAQFGGREPIIRRADLGAKGVYYRALVGPFASADQAAGMCSSLKAAGGSCIVQRN